MPRREVDGPCTGFEKETRFGGPPIHTPFRQGERHKTELATDRDQLRSDTHYHSPPREARFTMFTPCQERNRGQDGGGHSKRRRVPGRDLKQKSLLVEDGGQGQCAKYP